MGKKLKKGKTGPSTLFINRSKAIKKLQVSLKDFRRLCILKGIYPREPPKKLRKTNKTFYHVKDVNYLTHESLLDKFRQQKTQVKKIKKALARGDKLKARKLKARTPSYQLDHLVKERYPTFQDALNDLDDPLSLISLFASFPAHKELKIPNSTIQKCYRLNQQFLIYVAKSHALRKVFLSIKGIYYQAEIQGATTTWISPYPLAPAMPLDVDYKIMMTFLEFYLVMMRFVNFKLHGRELEEYESINKAVEQLKANEKQSEKFDEKFQDDELIKKMKEQEQGNRKYSSLFEGMIFYLYPETPRQSLEFVILSFGGTLGDTSQATHIVTERQIKEVSKQQEYIQPQWIYDCVLENMDLIEYKIVMILICLQILPPHQCPFEQKEQEEEQEIEEEDEQEDQEKQNDQVEVGKKVKQQKQGLSKKEEKKLAETVLSRKNKRLYDMIQRKEEEKKEKQKFNKRS